MTSKPTFLITGVNSGLGKFLHNNIKSSIGLTRQNSDTLLSQRYDNLVILHSAFNSKRDILNYNHYVEDNYIFTKKLMNLRYDKLVYFSTVDVYSKIFSPYSFMKRCAEDHIRTADPQATILRLSAILGPNIRRNSLLKLMDEENITLHKDSDFNYILQSDIMETLDTVMNHSGTFNFVSSGSVTLGEIAKHYSKNISFGQYRYSSNIEEYGELTNLYPYKDRTSMDVVKLFLEDYND